MAHRQWQDSSTLANKGKNDAYYNYQKKYEQMTKQQELIEQKKQEIQKRLEEKKRKETEEALKKLNEDKIRSESSRSKRNYYGYSKNKHWTGRERPVESAPAALPTNIFTNDGSFLEQFQKISGVRVDAKKRIIVENTNQSLENNGDFKNEEGSRECVDTIHSGEDKEVEKEEKRKERRWSSPERSQSHSPATTYQPRVTQQPDHQLQQQTIQHLNVPPQMMQQPHILQQQMIQQQPPLQQQVFTPQPMPPSMAMNFAPQFNPMQCGMMLPPPMTPSSIPPPAPLNPGSIPSPSPLQPCSIPSPSPLQPCSIPSPSPLQPYAIPPPSPLIPHSIPPPSPMVPHSIPPPSPLTPHSIPPPLPLRPQSIPPPLQRPSIFLSMVPPPPPPPPPEEEKIKVVLEEDTNSRPDAYKPDTKEKTDIDKVKDLFKNDEYSSSSEEENVPVYGPLDKHLQSDSDSDSEYERKSPVSNSDKESDSETDHKVDSMSDTESERGEESQPVPESESESDANRDLSSPPIVIEDTETQFPSESKDSWIIGEPAPPDLSSEGGSQHGQDESDSNQKACDSPQQRKEEVEKEEKDDNFNEYYETSNTKEIKEEKADIIFPVEEFKQEVKLEVQEEVKCEFIPEIKQEIPTETISADLAVKTEEPPMKKKRKSRWASSDEMVEVQPVMNSVPSLPPGMPPSLPPGGLGPVGMVMPKALGGVNTIVPPLPPSVPLVNVPGMSGAMISKVTRTDNALLAYAMKAFGRTNLTDAEWKKAEDHYKINLLYQDMMKKKEELQRLQAAGKNKYEYDSDEETEGGTWEHKLRSAEMEATQRWADELTEQAKGKHHIGDFLPPDELARFMEKYEALKEGREPDLSDYKEFKLKEDNVGFMMLQKMGWTEGQGLGPDGSGIMDPVNKAAMRPEGQGLGMDRPEDVEANDDEYDAYRKRMMLAYRFRPNPMNNPRRPYY